MQLKLKQLFGEYKNNSFHPSWILIIVALTILIGSLVWIIALLVPGRDDQSERLPSLSPTGPRIILVTHSASIS